MRKQSAPETAKLEQVLLWYDEPEILLLSKSALEYIIAVGDPSSDNMNTYVGASTTLHQLAAYQAGKFDLRYLMSHAALRRYWTFDYEGMEQSVKLKRVSRGSDVVAASLPGSGFFSRSHSEIAAAKQSIPNADEQFDIDGSWDLGEFSSLYGQIEDVYYIMNDMQRYVAPSATELDRSRISSAFNRPWQGGGSYVAYYDKIANDNTPIARLKVSGIQYNSPGFVRLKAKKEPFDSMIALLQSYAHEPMQSRKAYNALRKFLSFGGLLKAPDTTLMSKATAAEVVKLSQSLDRHMPGIDFSVLEQMALGNTLVAAKVLLSVFRRMERLFEFFEQGRVKYDGLEVDPLLDND